MKNAICAMFALFVALVLLGCAGGGGSKDPKAVMEEAFVKEKNLNSAEATYNFVMRVSGAGQEITMNGIMKMYQKAKSARVDMNFEGTGGGMEALEGIDMRVYVKDSAQYLCMKGGAAGSDWMCVEVSAATETPSVERYSELSKKLLDSGALSFEGGVQSKTVAGRACDEIKAKIDFSKMDFSEFDVGSTGADAKAIKEANLKSCFDSEVGSALSIEMDFAMDLSKIEGSEQTGELTMRMSMSASEFKPNVAVEDSVFELPAEPTEYPSGGAYA
ncbi:MAG: hypothetical protein AB1468_05775 [Candidatus Micrarchaeota archaeon]